MAQLLSPLTMVIKPLLVSLVKLVTLLMSLSLPKKAIHLTKTLFLASSNLMGLLKLLILLLTSVTKLLRLLLFPPIREKLQSRTSLVKLVTLLTLPFLIKKVTHLIKTPLKLLSILMGPSLLSISTPLLILVIPLQMAQLLSPLTMV